MCIVPTTSFSEFKSIGEEEVTSNNVLRMKSSSLKCEHSLIRNQSLPTISIRPIKPRQVLNNMFHLFIEMIVYLMNAMYMATVFDVDELFLPIQKQIESNHFTSSSLSMDKKHAKENSEIPTTRELPFERLTQSVSSLLSPPRSPVNKQHDAKLSPNKRNSSFTDLFAQSSPSPYSNLIVLNAHYEQMIMDIKQTSNVPTNNMPTTISTPMNYVHNNGKETTRKEKIKQTPLTTCDFLIPTIQIDCPPVEEQEISNVTPPETISLFESPQELNQARRRSNSFFPVQPPEKTLTLNGTNVDQHENPIFIVIPPVEASSNNNSNDCFVSNNVNSALSTFTKPTITRKKNSFTNLLKPNFPQPTICKLATLHN
ncbi:predicted protein [Naegleria gruberi]|uniref:Predicted protein n=1 Tax=Naegleria gruberi TaxID=5762 RepID=D2VNN3_NAEGR|nr:uncharacterized protein NAEGRDRAFT_51039 [Naegleria gruberi]EFC41438.1 predicted protein [Naegleria gruberi]|eukprot:XP_002674182.1 predicted protein [Naegleria gruberi strain NEG-M]